MSEEYNIGIDLGTTYSCLAYIDDTGNPVVEKNYEQEDTTPSVILFNDVGERIVGSQAKDLTLMYPQDRIIMDVKRKIGTDYRVTIDGKPYTPTTLSAMILSKMIRDFENAHGLENGDVKKAVITVPAYFGQEEREATMNAGRIAGIDEVTLLNEPTAAAICFGFGHNEGESKKVLIYDLGGGTFDVTILQIDGKTFTAIATDGERALGGKDWDEAIKKIVIEKITERSGLSSEEVEADSEVMERLILDSEDIKKRLSTAESTRGTMNIGGSKIIFSVTRDEFEQATKALLSSTIDIVANTLASKSLTVEDIDSFLLVGGSSKMPQVKNAMKERFPGANIKIYDPDQSVAKGAAVYSRSLNIMRDVGTKIESESPSDASDIAKKVDAIAMETQDAIIVHNVLSKSFGVKVKDISGNEYVSNIIFRNENLPIVKSRDYCPSVDGQRTIDVEIYEDNAHNVHDEMRTPLLEANLVGSFSMKLPEDVTKDTPIKIRFTVNDEGLINAHVECLNEHTDYELKTRISMSEEEILKYRGLIEKDTY